MPDGPPRIYLDTGCFQPLLFPGDHSIDDFKVSGKIRDQLRGDVSKDRISVVIPEVALGEAVSNYIEAYTDSISTEPIERPTEMIENLMSFQSQLKIEFKGMTNRGVEYAYELHCNDTQLGYNDAYIAACAIDDIYSTRIISKDPDLVDCEIISKCARELRTDRHFDLSVSYDYRYQG